VRLLKSPITSFGYLGNAWFQMVSIEGLNDSDFKKRRIKTRKKYDVKKQYDFQGRSNDNIFNPIFESNLALLSVRASRAGR